MNHYKLFRGSSQKSRTQMFLLVMVAQSSSKSAADLA